MSNHVVNLETNSSHIASDSKYQPLRDISEECSKRFLSSKKKLVSAMFSFKRESMMMLKTLWISALSYDYNCQSGLDKYKEEIPITIFMKLGFMNNSLRLLVESLNIFDCHQEKKYIIPLYSSTIIWYSWMVLLSCKIS